MAFDSSRGRCVLFGGERGSNFLGDTWVLDGQTWSQLTPTVSPPARQQASMTFDPWRNCVRMFGGFGVGLFPADTWELRASTWSQVATAATPTGRSQHALLHDYETDRTLLFGTHSTIGDDPLWSFTAAPAANFARLGQGCPGSNGTPSLDAASGAVPAIGSAFALDLTSLPTQPGTLLLAFGNGIARFQGSALPQSLAAIGLPQCQAWIALEQAIVRAHPGSALQVPLPIPPLPALAGTHLAVQALVLDPLAPGGIGAVSNAGAIVVQ